MLHGKFIFFITLCEASQNVGKTILPKILPGCTIYTLRRLLFDGMKQSVLPAPPVECGFCHATLLLSLAQRYFSGFPLLHGLLKAVRNRKNRPAKMNTTRSRRRNALGLALFYILALTLRNETENLEHQIRDERAHEVFAVPGIQHRHVDHADVDADILGQQTPLTLNLLIVPAQPVDTEDVEQIAGFQLFQHFLVLRTVEVLSGLFVNEGLLGMYRQKGGYCAAG